MIWMHVRKITRLALESMLSSRFIHQERKGSFEAAIAVAAVALSRRKEDSVVGIGGNVGTWGAAMRFSRSIC